MGVREAQPELADEFPDVYGPQPMCASAHHQFMVSGIVRELNNIDTEAKMTWESLMLDGYPGWEPMIFGATNILADDFRHEIIEDTKILSGDVKGDPVPVPDDIQ